MKLVFQSVKNLFNKGMQFAHQTFIKWTEPAKASQFRGTVLDLTRSKADLIAENALLRQQLIVMQRQVKQPDFKPFDQLLMVILANWFSSWRQALLIVKPATLMRWHRQGFRLFWKFKSKPKGSKPKIATETIALIKQMAAANRLWGAERIQGELLKLGIKVAKRTVQKYMYTVRKRPSPGKSWATFLRNHSKDIWACDFLPMVDLFFGQLYAFFVVEHGTGKVVHFGVTRHPTDEWTAQQLREATAFGARPKYLIRDNDAKFGPKFQKVAEGASVKILKTPIEAPKANSICERFLGSVRREALDHLLIVNERQLSRILKAYVEYFNQFRPHQGIGQAIPQPKQNDAPLDGKVISFPVMGGLHYHYERVA